METDVKKYNELEAYINELEAKPSELIAILHRAQHIFGYLPKEVQEFVAEKLNINVCLGTACFVRGADKILKEFESKLGIKNGETTEDGLFTLSSLRCVGACGLAPVVQVNGKTYGNATIDTVKEILEEYRALEAE